jgi:toxin ParE1/3/4
MRFALSRAALSDVEGIAEYTLRRWGKDRARSYVDALHGRLTELAHNPLLGRKRDELAPPLMSFPFESHVVFYMPTEFGIDVVRILHERQDPFRHFD